MAVNSRFIDLSGMKFGRLAVVKRTVTRKRSWYWSCRCDCGNMCEVEGHQLRRGNCKSCGCLQRERTAAVSTKHGLRKGGDYNPGYYQMKRKSPEFRLRKNVSCMVWKMLKQRKGGKSILPFLPFTIDQLKDHLESLFESWMSWDNYGSWHVDHRIPQIVFSYESLDDPVFRECWSLSNLRPLRAADNLAKGCRLGK